MSSEEYVPRYRYNDGYVYDSDHRHLLVGLLIAAGGRYIARSYIKQDPPTCGYPSCRYCSPYAEEEFETWHDADQWIMAENEKLNP